ncbi:MAG: metallophosphoesterase, partial [Candidatus Micrarchaeota archaeon]|nr:metallophosphoesterase [Candidatus Micrarchaeota archaeon]
AGAFEVKRAIIASDVEGNLPVVKQIFDRFYDRADLIVFLGDNVDRGRQGVETMDLLLSNYLKDDGKLLLLRGNHESMLMNQNHGFYWEVQDKLGHDAYPKFQNLFSRMPLAAVVNGYFLVHAGIAKGLSTVEQIKSVRYPDADSSDPIGMQLVWNDSNEDILGFEPDYQRSDYGVFYFGTRAVDDFLGANGLKGIIKGHEVVDGVRYQMGGKVVTVCTSDRRTNRMCVLEMEGGRLTPIDLLRE